MIRAASMTKTGPVVLLGITDENLVRLRAGLPIKVDLAEFGLGLVGDVVIFHGATHTEIVQQFREVGIDMPDPKRAAADAAAIDADPRLQRRSP